MREQLSPRLWTLEGKLPLSPGISESRGTGDPESVVEVELGGPGGELTNRLDMVSPKPPDGEDSLSPCAPIE